MRPEDEYHRRLALHEARADQLARQLARIGTARLAVAALTGILAWWTFPSLLLALVGMGVFAALVLRHHDLRRSALRVRRACDFYRAGLERIADRWPGNGPDGGQFGAAPHIYAADLDLFGRGGLFQLLCTTRTRMGEERLASWLLAGAPAQVITDRQVAVAELKGTLDLRESCAVSGDDPGIGVRPAALLQWARAPNQLSAGALRAAPVLPLLAVAGALVWALTGIASWFLLVVLAEAVVLYRLREPLNELLQGSEAACEDLRLLSELVRKLEGQQFESALLRSLIARLSAHGASASRAISQLNLIAGFAAARRNQFVAVVSVPLLYPLLVSKSAQNWRRRYGQACGDWIEAVGEFEALLALGGYGYEHPDDPFAHIVAGEPQFIAEGLGHPLIPAASCVRNDVRLDSTERVLLISGSNMSGKSTLLRTVGINTVLALAGAPVRARRLQLTCLQIGASIRVNDSLQEGSSRFYAEISRLRAIFAAAAAPPPLLFLLDELLQGTNSADRLAGAQGILRALLADTAIGLISTHDLALTNISAGVHNVHFRDEWREGQMTFDHRLHEGVVAKSNALELMRSIGLEV